jgi:hypothetical protein
MQNHKIKTFQNQIPWNSRKYWLKLTKIKLNAYYLIYYYSASSILQAHNFFLIHLSIFFWFDFPRILWYFLKLFSKELIFMDLILHHQFDLSTRLIEILMIIVNSISYKISIKYYNIFTIIDQKVSILRSFFCIFHK